MSGSHWEVVDVLVTDVLEVTDVIVVSLVDVVAVVVVVVAVTVMVWVIDVQVTDNVLAVVVDVVDVDVVLCVWIAAVLRKEEGCGCIQAWEETRQLPRKTAETNAHVRLVLIMLLFIIVIVKILLSSSLDLGGVTELWEAEFGTTDVDKIPMSDII